VEERARELGVNAIILRSTKATTLKLNAIGVGYDDHSVS